MEATYKVRGADGIEYGPVPLDQVRAWIGEGRIDATSQILRSDQPQWLPARSLSELQLPAAPVAAGPTPPDVVPAATPELETLEKRIKAGGSWFYWIAGLSLINSIVALSGKHGGFIIGLGITQIIDAVARGLGSAGAVVALVLDVLAAGLFVLFGVFATKKRLWAFMVGLIVYALDGLIFLLAGDWLGVGFHVFALLCIFAGCNATRKYKVATGT